MATALTLAAQETLTAQAVEPAFVREHERLRAAKLARPVFTRAEWVTNYEAARAKAKREDKLILAYFTRSYAA